MHANTIRRTHAPQNPRKRQCKARRKKRTSTGLKNVTFTSTFPAVISNTDIVDVNVATFCVALFNVPAELSIPGTPMKVYDVPSTRTIPAQPIVCSVHQTTHAHDVIQQRPRQTRTRDVEAQASTHRPSPKLRPLRIQSRPVPLRQPRRQIR